MSRPSAHDVQILERQFIRKVTISCNSYDMDVVTSLRGISLKPAAHDIAS